MASASTAKLPHLIGAHEIFYDIESIESLFSCIFMRGGWIGLWFFGSHEYDEVPDSVLLEALKDFVIESKHFQQYNAGRKVNLAVERFYANDQRSTNKLRNELFKVINCEPISIDPNKDDSGLIEYFGWNSSRYDLPLLVMSFLAASGANDKGISPADIRNLSDLIIKFDGKPWEWPGFIEMSTATTNTPLRAELYKSVRNLASWADGHIDIAGVLRQQQTGDDSQFPPNLKREMARFGMDVIIDDAVAGWHGAMMTDELTELIKYNCNDVLGTELIAKNSVFRGSLETRDIVRSMYPYTSARATPKSKLGKWEPPARDCTTANLAGLVLVGENRKKPTDWSSVAYAFPVPSENGFKTVDLLEYAKSIEKQPLPELFKQFFEYWRGKDTTTKWQMFQLTKGQPISHKATLTVPYYRNSRPVDSYATLSTGGAHGGVYAGLSDLDETAIRKWASLGGEVPNEFEPTLDLSNIVHLDFSSFYPTMSSKMQIYMTEEGIDRYTGIIDYRLRIKESLPEDKTQLTPEQITMQEQQMGLKLILNSATGAGNMHQKYALLPVDNKTLSMRLVGNMLIYLLGSRLTQAGGFVISTNTDGLYCHGLTVDECQAIVDEFYADYGIGIDPVHVDRFINRDTSNRIELFDNHVKEVRGRLRHAIQPHFTDDAIARPIPYPLASAHAALMYMAEDEDWLKKPYDRDRLRSILVRLYDDFDPRAWFHIWSGTSKSRIRHGGVVQQKVNRIVFTVDGKEVIGERARKLPNADAQRFWVAARQAVENGQYRAGKVAEQLGIELHEDIVNCDLRTLQFGHKEKEHGNVEVIAADGVPEIANKVEADEKTSPIKLSKAMSSIGSTFMLLTDEYGELKIVEAWKPTGITGYPSTKVDILNTAKSLDTFDKSKLDIDAYLSWAESLLQTWKRTSDLPSLGITKSDDLVVAGAIPKRRMKKIDIELEKINEMYGKYVNAMFGED